jgi:hypothetical protein
VCPFGGLPAGKKQCLNLVVCVPTPPRTIIPRRPAHVVGYSVYFLSSNQGTVAIFRQDGAGAEAASSTSFVRAVRCNSVQFGSAELAVVALDANALYGVLNGSIASRAGARVAFLADYVVVVMAGAAVVLALALAGGGSA